MEEKNPKELEDIKKTEEKEKVVKEKKEEIHEEEAPKESTMADVINNIYAQIDVINKELEALKLNQIWIQNYVTNVLKSIEVKE